MKEVVSALHAANGKGARKSIAKQADIYENATLANEFFSEECLGFIVYLLSTEDLFNKPGIEIFIVKLATDMDIISDGQRKFLLDALGNNYHSYLNIELCWHLGDLVARHYDKGSAMRFFQQQFISATSQGKEGIALGLDILTRQSKRDPRVMKEVSRILSKPD